ncbi:hypothetical protein FRX31_005941 [Thalictrum thalictroides]|uniref:Uncharacterized protein n=1 Tax=Thalictrum thalictroides TaxID=46969 RepID=A0A7J6X519_THATH|nr:hypothetical protein FRX31_005941 [Thalictrum thalictroides]
MDVENFMKDMVVEKKERRVIAFAEEERVKELKHGGEREREKGHGEFDRVSHKPSQIRFPRDLSTFGLV